MLFTSKLFLTPTVQSPLGIRESIQTNGSYRYSSYGAFCSVNVSNSPKPYRPMTPPSARRCFCSSPNSNPCIRASTESSPSRRYHPKTSMLNYYWPGFATGTKMMATLTAVGICIFLTTRTTRTNPIIVTIIGIIVPSQLVGCRCLRFKKLSVTPFAP